jgi:anti-sigma regulatory factor (Ser/Thr protein kinase)
MASPRRARTFLSEALRDWGREDLEERASIAVSEVVTNAVKHTHSRAVVKARYGEGRLEVRVEDDDDTLPEMLEPDVGSESGRGLLIVASLVDHWGVERLPDGGKAVYFAFDC